MTGFIICQFQKVQADILKVIASNMCWEDSRRSLYSENQWIKPDGCWKVTLNVLYTILWSSQLFYTVSWTVHCCLQDTLRILWKPCTKTQN